MSLSAGMRLGPYEIAAAIGQAKKGIEQISSASQQAEKAATEAAAAGAQNMGDPARRTLVLFNNGRDSQFGVVVEGSNGDNTGGPAGTDPIQGGASSSGGSQGTYDPIYSPDHIGGTVGTNASIVRPCESRLTWSASSTSRMSNSSAIRCKAVLFSVRTAVARA